MAQIKAGNKGMRGEKMTDKVSLYIPRVLDALKDDEGNLISDNMIYATLERGGIIALIDRFMRYYRTRRHIADVMTDEEQYDLQKKALFTRAQGGDNAAAKLWFELYSETVDEQTFNVNVKIVPVRIKDASLPSIIGQAEPMTVMEMLKGLDKRLQIDEAPHELREYLRNLAEGFDKWAELAYAPKDA